MGTDIHIVLERRVGFAWLGVCSGDYVPLTESLSMDQRNYKRFYALAGVGHWDAIKEPPAPRGIPEDASALTHHCIGLHDDDGYSHSHMLLTEAVPIFITTAVFGYRNKEPDDVFEIFGVTELDLPDEVDLDQYRIVFWFS